MPATRTVKVAPAASVTPAKVRTEKELEMYFPTTSALRAQFKTDAGKKLSAHQWAVYDFIMTIPVGKVTTYKDVCQAIGGSPRSVGGALRNNPFAPYVPCHRVIASSLFIGGFVGEWGKEHRTGTQYYRKVGYLEKEGVSFTPEGYLKSRDMLWKRD
ncbi:6-O-methylguanine DNA methyltransferase [Roridomyces roridus]|uniref:Methylated-DNA--protein-cysteine methyltransferase n=1 Tax=Roridomyces roridus TaxID=1738132 RepID=A0AAD7FH57_9AGAR|nr:6-O-methylguanine DNA methyltransferase [Roridomyces roridus]